MVEVCNLVFRTVTLTDLHCKINSVLDMYVSQEFSPKVTKLANETSNYDLSPEAGTHSEVVDTTDENDKFQDEISLKIQEFFCEVCGEEIENEELVKEGKFYCSEECFDRNSPNTGRQSRKVRHFSWLV